MGFHKHSFPIRMIETYKVPYTIVNGWANEDYTIGFHKKEDGKTWVATDLYSGMFITSGMTRKECIEWINFNIEKVNKRKEELSYFQRVIEFREILKKALAEKENC